MDRLALASHRQREQDLASIFSLEQEQYEREKAIYDQEWSAALKKAESTVDRQNCLDSLGAKPIAPLHPMLLTEEPTY